MNESQRIMKIDNRCSCASCFNLKSDMTFGVRIWICEAMIDICYDQGAKPSKVIINDLEQVCNHYDHDVEEFYNIHGENAGEYIDECLYNGVMEGLDFPMTLRR